MSFFCTRTRMFFFHGEFNRTPTTHGTPASRPNVMHHFLPILRDAKVYDMGMSENGVYPQ